MYRENPFPSSFRMLYWAKGIDNGSFKARSLQLNTKQFSIEKRLANMSIDLPFHRAWLDEDEINEVIDTLKSGWFTTGPKTHQLEEDFKNYIGCKHALGLNSCTAGLHLSLVVNGFSRGQ